VRTGRQQADRRFDTALALAGPARRASWRVARAKLPDTSDAGWPGEGAAPRDGAGEARKPRWRLAGATSRQDWSAAETIPTRQL
jgi:hypothetical protein